MEQSIKYDAWILWHCSLKCNFACEFCFDGFHLMTPQQIASLPAPRIDIERLISTLDKTGKIFKFTFTGGEPFLVPNMIEAAEALTKKHFISYNTNGSSPRLKEFADKIDPSRAVEMLVSCHIDQIEKRGLWDLWLSNVLCLKEKGFVVKLVEVSRPSQKKKLTELKKKLAESGLKLTFTRFIGKDGKIEYPLSYTEDDLRFFEMEDSKDMKTSYFGEPCNAGTNAFMVDERGMVYPCYRMKADFNKCLGSVYQGWSVNQFMMNCPVRCCECPLKKYEEELFKQLIKKNGRDNQ